MALINGSKIIKENSLMIEEMKKDIEYLDKYFQDSIEILSGWGHDYFCDIDGGGLIYDINKPHSHICPTCGKEYTGEKYDKCWQYIYRYNIMNSLVKSAYLYKITKEEKYVDYIKKILDFYKENYLKFKVQSKGRIIEDLNEDVGVAGFGRIMPQGLNEAIMLTRIVIALEIIKEQISKEWLEELYDNFLKHAVELIDKQRVRVHNITLWIGTAIAGVGLLLGNKKIVKEVYKSKFGILDQLEQGFTEDGFWYEGSIHYNYFALEGVLNFIFLCDRYGVDLEKSTKDKVLKILRAPYYYAFNNSYLPNPNDGWPDISLKTYSFLYYLGYAIYGKELEDILCTIENSDLERTDVGLSKPYYFQNKIPLEKLLYAYEFENKAIVENRVSTCFKESSFGILKNKKINLFMKYGHLTSSHYHPDKMNIEITYEGKYLSRDISNPGYGSKICSQWNRTSLGHNTVILNGENQDSIDKGELKVFSENIFEVESSKVYDGKDVTYKRKLEIKDNEIIDIFEVKSKENENIFDWVFHLENGINLIKDNLVLENGDLKFEKNGYDQLKNIKKVTNSIKEITIDFYGKKAICEIDLKEKELFIAESYDNPGNKFRTAIIIRSLKKEEKFKVHWIF